jgi:hypothetical protein
MKQAQEILAKHTKLHPNLLRNEITIISNHALKAMEEFALQFEDDNGRANYYEDKIDLLNRINLTDNKRIEELEKQIPKWISIKNEFPKKNQRFLGYNGNLAIYINSAKQVFKIWEITHWMPLPNKPILTSED